MKRRNIYEMEFVDQILCFDANDLKTFLDEDDNEFFEDDDDFDYWQDIAYAMQYLEDKEIEYNYSDINDYEDYISIAKANGYYDNYYDDPKNITIKFN